MTLPNFFIIGAPKAGTTTIYHYLAEHPQVAMGRVKEPCFFSFDDDSAPPQDETDRRRFNRSVRTLSEYQELFCHCDGAEAIGEASANYLANEGAPRRIHKMLPQAKLIAIIRNPADRAYSAYWQDIRKGYEHRPFHETIHNWETREDTASRFITEGLYHAQLSRYEEFFDRDQILVLLMDDLQRDPLETMRRVHRFLGIREDYAPDTSVTHNQGGIPKSAMIEKLLYANWAKRLIPKPLVAPARKLVINLRSRNRIRPQKMNDEMRLQLGKIFHDDICQLEEQLGRDLSAWLPQRSKEQEAVLS